MLFCIDSYTSFITLISRYLTFDSVVNRVAVKLHSIVSCSHLEMIHEIASNGPTPLPVILVSNINTL